MMAKRAYGVQLYSVRKSFSENLDKTLEKVAKIGYKGVEFYGSFSTYTPEEIVSALTRHNLEIVGWHTGVEAYDETNFDATVAFFKAIGNTRGVIPGVPEEWYSTPEAAADFGRKLTEIGRKLRVHGIETGYHNHGKELIPFENGLTPWEMMMDHSEPFVIGQLDNGNALSSGNPNLDVCAMVSKYPGRGRTVHLKPYSREKKYSTMIGQDDIDWPKFLQSATTIGGAQWMIVEYEDAEAYEEFEGVRLCLEALEKIEA